MTCAGVAITLDVGYVQWYSLYISLPSVIDDITYRVTIELEIMFGSFTFN